MKTRLYLLPLFMLLVCGCTPMQVPYRRLSRAEAYREVYVQQPRSILILPPLNLTADAEAAWQFYSTLYLPLANAGYYVIPPALTRHLLMKEQLTDHSHFSSHDYELLDELFAPDMILLTTLKQWEKGFGLQEGEIIVEAEYRMVLAKTRQEVFNRRTTATYYLSSKVEGSKFLSFISSTVRTASTRVVEVARACTNNSFSDFPFGPYSPHFMKDSREDAGPPTMVLVWGSGGNDNW